MHEWALTFDMSGGLRQAQLAGGRPLDGRVRAHCMRRWHLRQLPSAQRLRGLSSCSQARRALNRPGEGQAPQLPRATSAPV